MNIFGKIAVIYLIAMLFFAWGAASIKFRVFPYSLLKPISDFIEGDRSENLTLMERLQNDFGDKPTRMMRDYTPADRAAFKAVEVEGLNARREAPRLFLSDKAPEKYRLLVGAFDFDTAFWGAILLNPEGEAVHSWRMNGDRLEISEESDLMKILYGVAFFPDGSAAFSMQETSGGFIKVDYCSQVDWIKPGLYHHVAQPTEDMTAFWTFGGPQGALHPTLLLLDEKTGETLREIDMTDVERANPDIHIFDMRRTTTFPHATHPNHIEALPTHLDAAFPQFAPGDLILSYHTTNLVFVIDPDSLKIKWWYTGASDTQHDPDWHADGTISVFNNRERAYRQAHLPKFSTIVSIDPQNYTHRTVVDGADYNFHSTINGHHEFSEEGTVLITSSTQGRFFEVDTATGEVVFDFVNSYNWEEGKTLHISEAFFVDPQTVARWRQTTCADTTQAQGN